MDELSVKDDPGLQTSAEHLCLCWAYLESSGTTLSYEF